MKKFIVYLFSAIILISCSDSTSPQEPVKFNSEVAKDIMTGITKIRSGDLYYQGYENSIFDNANKKQSLYENNILNKVAKEQINDMYARNYYNEIDPDGKGLNYKIDKAGYKLNPLWYANIIDNAFVIVGFDLVNEQMPDNMKYGYWILWKLFYNNNNPAYSNLVCGDDEWNAGMTDIGVAYGEATNSNAQYKNIVIIIIARHN